MKWKLTSSFVFTVILVAIIVTIINIMAIMLVMFWGVLPGNNGTNNRDVSSSAELDSESFTREFNRYLVADNDTLFVSEEGKNILDNSNIWIQILDEDGKEVYNYKKTNNTPAKYTPFQIAHGYKYSGVIGEESTILIGEKMVENKQYSYIIGFPMQNVRKILLIYNTDETRALIKKISLLVLIINSIIALFLGYLFSRKLTKPLDKIIFGVGELEAGNYDRHYTAQGIYKDVFYQLNNLSETLKYNKKERLKLDKMRDEWISNISHDIKTPLATIKGYAEIVSNDEYELSRDDIKSYARIINKQSNYIKDLVDDLNLTARLKNNASILNKREINLVTLVKEAVIDILNDPRYCERDINFMAEKNVMMKAVDDILLRRVIHNLIYNALVHNTDAVTIDVKIIKDENIHIYIKDNGKGIMPAEVENIFTRYYRGTNTGEKHKGSGLGMAIAKEIVLSHNGEIKISSIVGKGTEVEIIL